MKSKKESRLSKLERLRLQYRRHRESLERFDLDKLSKDLYTLRTLRKDIEGRNR